ncbi:MAG TPA: sulfurtransferase complex subunit TusC [Anaerolineae bacterium]|jgi:tRNA 2-thiouridine synthesizing protein C|nr:sulfurtransferase complex subunit TusC [Anaerolineae bacterium]
MIMMRKAPYGTIYSFEGLESVLIMGAYEQDISLIFVDDGVYSIKKGMDTTQLGIKNFSPTFRVLEGYDIEKLYIDRESMESRGLTLDDFVVEPEVLDKEEITKLMEEQDAIFPF